MQIKTWLFLLKALSKLLQTELFWTKKTIWIFNVQLLITKLQKGKYLTLFNFHIWIGIARLRRAAHNLLAITGQKILQNKESVHYALKQWLNGRCNSYLIFPVSNICESQCLRKLGIISFFKISKSFHKDFL